MKCKVHGELEEDDIYFYTYLNGKKVEQCSVCKLNRKYSARKKSALLAIKKEKNKTIAKEQYWRDVEKSRALYRKKSKEYRDTLHDVYVKKKLIRQFGLKSKDVTPEMIQIKRVMLEIERKKRENNDESV